jgi:hypothetical protein
MCGVLAVTLPGVVAALAVLVDVGARLHARYFALVPINLEDDLSASLGALERGTRWADRTRVGEASAVGMLGLAMEWARALVGREVAPTSLGGEGNESIGVPSQ